MLANTTNEAHTAEFLRRIRTAYPRQNRNKIAIVLDNHPAHKTDTIKVLARNLNMELLYLPPYKPEMNPIESLWSVVKRNIKMNLLERQYETLTQTDFEDLVSRCLNQVSPDQQCRAARTNSREYMLKVLSNIRPRNNSDRGIVDNLSDFDAPSDGE
jgi:transposase